jgi:hypothetical protein
MNPRQRNRRRLQHNRRVFLCVLLQAGVRQVRSAVDLTLGRLPDPRFGFRLNGGTVSDLRVGDGN